LGDVCDRVSECVYPEPVCVSMRGPECGGSCIWNQGVFVCACPTPPVQGRRPWPPSAALCGRSPAGFPLSGFVARHRVTGRRPGRDQSSDTRRPPGETPGSLPQTAALPGIEFIPPLLGCLSPELPVLWVSPATGSPLQVQAKVTYLPILPPTLRDQTYRVPYVHSPPSLSPSPPFGKRRCPNSCFMGTVKNPGLK
jgi:hypothetical protein